MRAQSTSSRPSALHALPALLAAGAGAALFLFFGNTHEPARYGPSVLSWLAGQWRDPGSGSGHGWMVPLVSLAILWKKRRDLMAARKTTCPWALLFIIPALFLFWAGSRSQQPRLGVLCLIALSWAVPLYLWGRETARHLVFPCAYLLFALPLGFLQDMTLPLRLASSAAAVTVLNGIGIASLRVGTAIYMGDPRPVALDVADACSGLQYTIAMTALTAAYAYFTQKTLWKQGLLFAASLPLAMAANAARIVTIAVIARALSVDAAMKVYHDYSGYLVFAVAVILMTSFGALLHKAPGGLARSWLRDPIRR